MKTEHLSLLGSAIFICCLWSDDLLLFRARIFEIELRFKGPALAQHNFFVNRYQLLRLSCDAMVYGSASTITRLLAENEMIYEFHDDYLYHNY